MEPQNLTIAATQKQRWRLLHTQKTFERKFTSVRSRAINRIEMILRARGCPLSYCPMVIINDCFSAASLTVQKMHCKYRSSLSQQCNGMFIKADRSVAEINSQICRSRIAFQRNKALKAVSKQQLQMMHWVPALSKALQMKQLYLTQ